jgi:hypothetical protein
VEGAEGDKLTNEERRQGASVGRVETRVAGGILRQVSSNPPCIVECSAPSAAGSTAFGAKCKRPDAVVAPQVETAAAALFIALSDGLGIEGPGAV